MRLAGGREEEHIWAGGMCPLFLFSGSLHRRRTVGNWLGGVWHLLDGQTGKSTLSPTIRYLAGEVLMIMHLFLLFIYFLFF